MILLWLGEFDVVGGAIAGWCGFGGRGEGIVDLGFVFQPGLANYCFCCFNLARWSLLLGFFLLQFLRFVARK
jgi:hypothetical protein